MRKDRGEKASTPRSEVSDEDRLSFRDMREGGLDHDLAVRTRDQRAGIAQEVETVEFGRAEDVLERFTSDAACNDVRKSGNGFIRNRIAAARDKVCRLTARNMGQQPAGFEPGRIYASLAQLSRAFCQQDVIRLARQLSLPPSRPASGPGLP